MRIHGFSVLLLSVFLTAACSKKKELTIPEWIPEFLTQPENEFSGKLFLIGPELDSVNARVVADCDCCASDLAFMNDSTFLYVELCLGGDVYIKGKYRAFGDLLMLQTDEKVLSSEYEYADTSGFDFPINYEVVQQEIGYHAYKLSTLKGKRILTYRKNDYEEYGMLIPDGINRFVDKIKYEKEVRRYVLTN